MPDDLQRNNVSPGPEQEKALSIKNAISTLRDSILKDNAPEAIQASEDIFLATFIGALDPNTGELPDTVMKALQKNITQEDVLFLITQFSNNGDAENVTKLQRELRELSVEMPTSLPTEAGEQDTSVAENIKEKVTTFLSGGMDSKMPGVQKLLNTVKGFNISQEKLISMIMNAIAAMIEGYAGAMPFLADISGEIRFNELPMTVKNSRLPPEEKERILAILKTPEARDRFLDAYANWLSANSGEGRKAPPLTYKAALEKEVVAPAAPTPAPVEATTEVPNAPIVVDETGVNFFVKTDDVSKIEIKKKAGDAGIYSVSVSDKKLEVTEMKEVQVIKATTEKEAQVIFTKTSNVDEKIIVSAAEINAGAIAEKESKTIAVKSTDKNTEILFQPITSA